MTLQSLPYITLLGFLFGSTLVVSRFSIGQFAPTTYIGLRLSLAGLAFVLIYLIASRRRPWPTDRRLWKHAAVLGILGTAVPMTGFVSALQYLSSGLASVLITTGPAVTLLLAHIFLPDESLTRRKAAGVALALGGAVLLALRGESGLGGSANPIGYLLIFMGILFGNSATIYARKYMRDFDSFDVTSIRMFAAALVVMPLSAVSVGFDLQAVTGAGYLALLWASIIGTFAGMLLAFYNIKRFGATVAAMTAYIIPIVAGLGGALLLDEKITPIMLVGMLLIVVGITIINRKKTARPSAL